MIKVVFYRLCPVNIACTGNSHTTM